MKLLIVSHVVHYQWQGKLYAWGPYAREINIWADLFSQVVIAAPCCKQKPPADNSAFASSNISITPQLETGGRTLWAKVYQLIMLPVLLCSLMRAMRQVDAIHVRCPGNLGLLGVILAPLFSKYRIAKYAGQWNGYAGEPWTVCLQRFILRSGWWRAPVVVYGKWDNQPKHIIPFFTSIMTKEQVKHAANIAKNKLILNPLKILFSGRLVSNKRVDALLEAIKIIEKDIEDTEVVIVGDGPERDYLEDKSVNFGLGDKVSFTGALSFDEALKWLEWADCLVLPSIHSEGWPKVIAEAMSYGVLCIAVDHGQISNMLKDRGIILESGSPQEIADSLLMVARQPEKFRPIVEKACVWAQQYSLEKLNESLKEVMVLWWNIQLK
jgi:glycosyltransferase involved in cell wall biosynthesis